MGLKCMRALILGCMVAVIGAWGVACSSPTVCDLSFEYGMSIYVRDSASGAGLANGSTVVVRDGSFLDSLAATFTTPSDGPFLSAGERAGTYTVTVLHNGYQTWTKAGVVVTRGACHVNHIDVIVRLQP